MDHRVTENAFAEWIESIVEFRGWIAAIFLSCVAAGILYLLLVPPTYISDALLQVEEKERGLSGIGDATEVLQRDAIVSEKAKIVTSRSVLGQVVDVLSFDKVATPEYLPVIGKAIARWNAKGEHFREPWKLFKHYAWGGESLRFGQFEVPDSYYDKPFTLVAGSGGQYRLFDQWNQPLGNGNVGAKSVFSLPDGGGEVTLQITELNARPGCNFELRRLSRLAAIQHLQEKVKVEESVRSPNAPMKSGLLQISYESNDALDAANTVDTLVKTYIAQNMAYKSSDIDRTQSFVKEQQKVLKTRMEQSEKDLSDFQHRNGLVDLPKEANVLLDRISGLDSKISEEQRNREEMSQNFTDSHYRMVDADTKIASLEDERNKLMQRMEGLPALQQELVGLSRNVQINQHLYTLLLNKSQELQLIKAGTTGDVRILDGAAVPVKPARPNKSFVIMVSVALGLLAGMGAAMMRRRMREVVRDPDMVEQHLGLPVLAVVPNSKKQASIIKDVNRPVGLPSVLARIESQDVAVESLRSLRTMLELGRTKARNKIILITGPAPNVGKSFVAVNLATVLAGMGRNVLLIDADFRRGQIHKLMKIDNGFGLSDLLASQPGMDLPVRLTQISNLDILPTGPRPENPSEMLMQPRCREVINELSKHYDFLVIDSPPVLAVTDAAIIGKLASTVLLVVKAGGHHMREIEQSIKHLHRAGVKPQGIIFNGMTFSRSGYGYGRYYGYAYASSMKS